MTSHSANHSDESKSPALIETKSSMAELAVIGITLPRWLVHLSLGFLFGVALVMIGVWLRAPR